MQHLHLVLQRLQEYGLVLNMEKCELARQEIDFLGHHITAEGASPILRHVQAIQDFPAPRDKKQLQTFLGMVNFYRRFIPAAANILLPLTDALRADWSWVWAPAINTASSWSKTLWPRWPPSPIQTQRRISAWL